jgi:hypothetical protein
MIAAMLLLATVVQPISELGGPNAMAPTLLAAKSADVLATWVEGKELRFSRLTSTWSAPSRS